ncbi:hypothetical protein LOZ80_15170 [Paenibacillus sp. HWE-109]|uniref:hypothetical protein n=1 Tax=Paenibacillus sp. HWE-109 TaxID=1306526 RepID=UPI001EDC9A5C|nr:hypothetical protein [Paenibacillus sp. HWE-109]UKS30201.1 hypothetical protein LOZ80_15170 [Paenibacillus sp. HWE-109]
MAKLNGVTAVSEQISYNGVNYAKSYEDAVVGDIVRMDKDGFSFLPQGAFYEVITDSDGDASIIDEDGDPITPAGEFTVFKRIETTQEPAEDVIVHEGVKYRKVARQANVGDLAILVSRVGSPTHYFLNVPVVVNVKYVSSSDGDIEAEGICERGDVITQTVSSVDYRVLEALTESDIITYEGAQYRKVARAAVEGDLIVAIKPDHNCDDYQIGYVTKLYIEDDVLWFKDSAKDRRRFNGHGNSSNFAVLEPVVPTPTPQPNTLPSSYVIHDGKVYVKETRKADVGETIILTQGYFEYNNGDVTKVSGLCGSDMIYGEKRGRDTVMLPERYNVLVPTDTVTIGDTEYTLEKRKAAEGDTVLIVKAAASGGRYGNGTIGYDVKVDAWSDPEINGSVTISSEYLVLVPKVEAQPAAEPTSTSDIKANVGDRIRITGAFGTEGKYADGDEFVVKSVRRDGRVYVAEHDRPIAQSEYEIITQPQYTEVKRKANVGERIRIVEARFTSGRYSNGDVVTVNRVTSSGGAEFTTQKGEDAYAYLSEYVVLESTAAKYEPQPGDKVRGKSSGRILTLTERKQSCDGYGRGKAWRYAENASDWIGEKQFDVIERAADVKKPEGTRLKVGEYAKVLNKDGSACLTGYDIGSIAEVIEYRVGHLRPYHLKSVKGTTGFAEQRNVIRATEAEVSEAQRKAAKAQFSVGDIVKLTSGGGDWPLCGFNNGETYVIHDLNPRHSKSGAFRIREIGKSSGGGYATPEQLVNVTNPADAKTEFSVGDFARVVGNERGHGANIGDIVKIIRDDNSGLPFKCTHADGKEIYGGEWFMPSELVKLTPAEAEQERKAAEGKAQQAALEAKWAAIGRKVGEFKVGDLVRVLDTLSSSMEIGEITTVVNPDGTNSPEVRHKDGDTRYATVELIAPVESLFNAAK